MSYNDQIQSKSAEIEVIKERLLVEFGKLRSGRASSTLVDNIMIDYYGTPTPLKQAANVSVPEARQIVIQPWDKGVMDAIMIAIRKSDLGISPSNDGSVIRISLPPMTEENRKDLVKVVNQRAEGAKVSLRAVREVLAKDFTKQQKAGELSEDELFSAKDTLQKVIDKHSIEIEKLRSEKEQDVLTV